MKPFSVFILAVENSGDQLGAGLINALQNNEQENFNISGIGGRSMAKAGVSSAFDISGLAILGFTEALKSYGLVLRKVREAVDLIMNESPDAVVLIDSWGFMVRVAKELKKREFSGQIIKYVAPQVWAMREGRAKVLAKYVDHLLTIHHFDIPYFTRHGLPTYAVGNPVFDTDYQSGSSRILQRYANIDLNKPICALFIGSRLSELKHMWEPILSAVEMLSLKYPELQFISPVSNSLALQIKKRRVEDKRSMHIHFLAEDTKLHVFAAADVAIACSGTVTSQLAASGVPSVVGYKLNPTTWVAAKRLYKPDFISLVNISAGEPLMPEYLQGKATGEALAQAASVFLDDEDLRVERSKALVEQTKIMRGNGGLASVQAADRVTQILCKA